MSTYNLVNTLSKVKPNIYNGEFHTHCIKPKNYISSNAFSFKSLDQCPCWYNTRPKLQYTIWIAGKNYELGSGERNGSQVESLKMHS